MASIKDVGRGRCLVSWYDTHGKQHRRTVIKKTAQDLYDQVCAQEIFEKSGLHPSLGAKAKNIKTMLVRDAGLPYRKYLAGTRAYRNVSYVDHILRKWGDWRICQLTPGQVRLWLYDFLNGPVRRGEMAVSTVKKIAVYFNRIFNYAIEELEILSQNPLKGLMNKALRKEFRRVKKRTKTINADEFWILVRDFPKWIQRVCVCAWFTGMRLDEILSLTWNKVNLIERLIDLGADDTKEGDVKKAGIEQELYDVLIEIQTERGTYKPHDNVFLSVKGRKVNQNFFERKFRKLADKAGFTDLKFHDFRHCYTVRKRREGHDRSVIKAQTGHHTDSMFNWYDKVDQFEIQEMAGFTQISCEAIQMQIDQLVKSAKDHGIPLGAVQALIGRLWRTAA
jgi:integrase